MKSGKFPIISVFISIIIIALGAYNLATANVINQEVIMITILLVIIGVTYAMSTFVPAWLKSAVFVDGVIFGISYFFTNSPLNIIFGVVGVLLLALSILAYLGKLPNSLLRLFYQK